MCECVVVTQLTTVAHSFGNVHLKHTLTTCTFSIPHNISGLTMGHAKLFHFHVTEKKCSLFFVLFVFKSFLSHKKQYKRDEKFFLPLLYYSMIVMMSEVCVEGKLFVCGTRRKQWKNFILQIECHQWMSWDFFSLIQYNDDV